MAQFGRAVANDIRNLWFKSSHRQYYLLSTVLKSFIEKTEKSKKRPGMAQF